MIEYDPSNWYWIVGGDETRAWSSRVGGYLAASDPAFVAWRDSGGLATRIRNEFELDMVLRQQVASEGIGRTFSAQEALDALVVIDASEVRRVLGRSEIAKAHEGDADKLADFAYRLQPARRVDALTYPPVAGTSKAISERSSG